MAQKWENLPNGQLKLTITSDLSDDDTPPVTIYGKDKDEILTKLAASKINGDRRINELRRAIPNQPAPTAPSQPKPLTQADRLQVVADLGNPATVDRAVTRVVESAIGPLDELRQDRERTREERELEDAVKAAATFADNTPDWYPTEHNKRALMSFMEVRGWSASKPERYTQAFEELMAAGLLQKKPAEPAEPEDETEPPAPRQERTAPTPTPTPKAPASYSTGVRARDISGSAPPPRAAAPRLKYTREQIAKMGAKDYKQKMLSDPELPRCVEFYAQQDAAKTRRAG